MATETPEYASALKQDILGTRRNYFIWDVKGPLLNSLVRSVRGYGLFSYISMFIDVWKIVRSVNRYPEPTKENSDKPNVHWMIDFWDNFEKYNGARVPLFRALRRIKLCEYQHDDFYAERHDKYIREVMSAIENGSYILPSVSSPTSYWSDPKAIKELALARMGHATEGENG